MSKFYITTAIDYVNSRPHLGTAYEKITADIIARYKRLAGVPTHFLMGNDEHSLNVFRRAKEQGLDAEGLLRPDGAGVPGGVAAPRRVVRRLHPDHRGAPPRRRDGACQRIQAAGDIYEGHYEGWYCKSCEAFKQEKDLVDGLCPVHRTKPDWITEKNHFFRLSKYQQPLLDHYARHPEFARARGPAQRDPERHPGRPRRHLHQPRGPGVGHPAAVRPAERRLRLVRRAHQLHLRARLRRRRRRGVRAVVAGRRCTSSARTSRASTASSGRRC